MRVKVLLVCWLLLPAGLGADTKIMIQVQSFGDSTEQHREVLYLTSGKVRQEREGGDTFVIYDQPSRVFHVVDSAEKSYLEASEPRLADVQEQTRDAVLAAVEKMKARADEAEGVEKERMAQVLALLVKSQEAATRAVPRYQRTSITESVLGQECVKVNVFQNDLKTAELCMAPIQRLGIAAKDYQALKAMQSSAPSATFAMNRIDLGEPTSEEIPLSMILFDEQGEKTLQLEVEAISTSELDAALFQIPGDYKKQVLQTPSR
jgi:hypothetical protein